MNPLSIQKFYEIVREIYVSYVENNYLPLAFRVLKRKLPFPTAARPNACGCGARLLGYSDVPRNCFRGGGGSANSVEDTGQRGQGSGGGSPLFRGSGGSCNLVQEISFHIVKFS